MADKNFSFTASDLLLGNMTCGSEGDLFDSAGTATITIEVPYNYLDSGDVIIAPLGRSKLSLTKQMSELTTEVQDAVRTLSTFVKGEALAKEGM